MKRTRKTNKKMQKRDKRGCHFQTDISGISAADRAKQQRLIQHNIHDLALNFGLARDDVISLENNFTQIQRVVQSQELQIKDGIKVGATE